MASSGQLIAKVFIDFKEYNRLKEIEKRYVAQNSTTLQGAGVCQCGKGMPLSQIVQEKESKRDLTPPQKGILPSITNPEEINNDGISEWYYLGPYNKH